MLTHSNTKNFSCRVLLSELVLQITYHEGQIFEATSNFFYQLPWLTACVEEVDTAMIVEESDQFHSAVSMGGWEVAVVLLLEEGVTLTDIHSTLFFCCY